MEKITLHCHRLVEVYFKYVYYIFIFVCFGTLSLQGKEYLEKQIALLPRVNYNLLSYICR